MPLDLLFSGDQQLSNNVEAIVAETGVATDQATRAEAEKINKKIKQTAPVDTGQYRDDWSVEKAPDSDERADYYIRNTVDYGSFLVFPNSRMRGVQHADDPARGILHNVRGIVHSESKEYEQSIVQSLIDNIFGKKWI